MRFDAAARSWVESLVGESVLRTRRLPGGVSSVIHRVDTTTGRYVLRRVPRSPRGATDVPADDIRREAEVLTALEGRALVPRLVAADPSGEACGAPASLQTLLPGRPDTAPRNLDRWLDGMAEAIGVAITSGVDASPFSPHRLWIPVDREPPAWATDLGLWWAAIERCKEWPPAAPDVLVHRDLHPANILYHRGRLSGVVDWANACRGPAVVDVSRCRVEVAFTAGIEAADGLLERCHGYVDAYDPMWDACVVLEFDQVGEGFLQFNHFGSRLTLDGIRATLDQLLRRAMS